MTDVNKSTVRSYVAPYELTDRTKDMLVVPNIWGLTQQLGIFTTESVSQETVTFEEITKTYGLLEDRIRGQRATLGKDHTRKMYSFFIPHFPHDDYITPRDVRGKVAFGSGTGVKTDNVETLAAVRARKLERIRMNHSATLEVARMHTIVTGTAYAPSGTVSYDWYAEFGKTRKVVDFDTATPTTDMIAKVEEVIAYIQDNTGDGSGSGDIYGICSPEFFSAFIAHPTMKEAYKYYASGKQILRERLTASGLDARFREFVFGGVNLIEYRGTDINGKRFVPVGEAYFLPKSQGDEFVTYFAPAEKFDLVNTMGLEAYVWEYADEKGEKITLESETNFLNVLRKPQLVVKATL
ncbi:major capsid protein [Pseudomonas phage vB_PseuGesM_254]|uniref:Major capsid protein n=1 Tax=Pseudomonas phage vB_PseuGesM_254 TaxID=3092638 RepID=A0AAX4G6H2_9CAUD|nr:major capsid protein [Pseudomonas phage PseuGes_254]